MSEQTLTKQFDEKFCNSCGAAVKIAAEICPKCGVRQNAEKNGSNWTVLLYLSFWLGFFGVDRFYVGKIGSGIIKLLTYRPPVRAMMRNIIPRNKICWQAYLH